MNYIFYQLHCNATRYHWSKFTWTLTSIPHHECLPECGCKCASFFASEFAYPYPHSWTLVLMAFVLVPCTIMFCVKSYFKRDDNKKTITSIRNNLKALM